jgi:hypothetical protein
MPDNGSNILVGWKEIAAYLGVCERTAKSYEKDGLPVYRRAGRLVRALKSELDKWTIEEFKKGRKRGGS